MPHQCPESTGWRGERRIRAAELLGWDSLEITIIHTIEDAQQHLMAERDANTCHKPMLTSELVALGARLEELETPKAKQRQRDSGREYGRGMNSPGSPEPHLSPQPDRVRDRVGKALGVSDATYNRLHAFILRLVTVVWIQ
jgi:hypothetical protein